MLIGGSLVQVGNEEQILNPRTGEIIVTLPEASLAQVDAVAAAEKVFATWSRTTGSAVRAVSADRRPDQTQRR